MAFLVDINPDIWPAEAQNDGQIINIVGGVSLMAAQFVVSFWYGTCHITVLSLCVRTTTEFDSILSSKSFF